jgi:hypothetical protein
VIRRQDASPTLLNDNGPRPTRATCRLPYGALAGDLASQATTAAIPSRASSTPTPAPPRAPSTSDLLDRAYAVVDDGAPAAEERWWATIWSIVKRIESRLRSGAERGDAGDERRLVKAIERYQTQGSVECE